MTDRKILITRYRDKIMTAFLENGRTVEFRFDWPDRTIRIGNVYAGIVKDVKRELSAAFIEIQPDVACFYHLSELSGAHFLVKRGKKEITPGDELLVQVRREAAGTKQPSVSTEITIPGEFLVVTGSGGVVSFSKKIAKERRKDLEKIVLPYCRGEIGFIVRTNAAEASQDMIEAEASYLSKRYEQLFREAGTRKCRSLLYEAPPEYCRAVLDAYRDGSFEVVTDLPEIAVQIQDYTAEKMPSREFPIRLYDDVKLPLIKCYRLEKAIHSVLSERVWLESGAFLVIQKTEALTVVDVNSGKAEAKSHAGKQVLLYKVNLEAAKETARQIRLRNLSGIIIVDFINMKEKAQIEEIAEHLNQCLLTDPVSASVTDITKLQLVEITRKKVRRPVFEELVQMKEED